MHRYSIFSALTKSWANKKNHLVTQRDAKDLRYEYDTNDKYDTVLVRTMMPGTVPGTVSTIPSVLCGWNVETYIRLKPRLPTTTEGKNVLS